MPEHKELRILVATDGSRHAQGAIATTLHFPWGVRTRVRAVVARGTGTEEGPAAVDGDAGNAAEKARRRLARRWPDVEIEVVDEPPVEGILGEAERFKADVIALGWRGHGAVRRLLMGSVSRGVVRGSQCSVLVVRRAYRVRHIVVGFDGSATARRALAFVGRLLPPPGGQVTLVRVVDLATIRARRAASGAGAAARRVRRTNTIKARVALRDLNRAADGLARRGWRTQTMLLHGEPLRELLDAVAGTRAQLLAVGATGSSDMRHLLLGSVAEGALNRCPVAVLVAR